MLSEEYIGFLYKLFLAASPDGEPPKQDTYITYSITRVQNIYITMTIHSLHNNT
jgi:hypothetical protein